MYPSIDDGLLGEEVVVAVLEHPHQSQVILHQLPGQHGQLVLSISNHLYKQRRKSSIFLYSIFLLQRLPEIFFAEYCKVLYTYPQNVKHKFFGKVVYLQDIK